jgi:ABC-type branched-subunit amino acid transport system substrate-binding protein
MLALPGVEPTEISADAGPDTGAPKPGRRRVLALAAGGAALLAAGGGAALWAALRDDDKQDPAAQSTGPRRVLGVHADLSGPQKEAGAAQERAARLAVEQFNSREDKPFTLALRVVDDGGEATRAERVARQLTGEDDVLAVLGPTGYASAEAALEVYEAAGLSVLTVSELSVTAAQSALLAEPKAYFRTAPMAAYTVYGTVLTLAALGSRRPGLLIDRAGRITGMESAQIVRDTARARQAGLYARVVPAAAPDASVVIADMLAHDIDGFFCTGTPERAATVARAMAERGFAGPRFLDAPTATAAFITAAGDAADGWQTLTPYVSPDGTPVRAFATAYRKRYGSAPGIWAPEAYDTARLVADRLTALAREGVRRPSRAQVTTALTKARFKGLSTTYAFSKSKQLTVQQAYHYRVDGGRFVYVGTLPTS